MLEEGILNPGDKKGLIQKTWLVQSLTLAAELNTRIVFYLCSGVSICAAFARRPKRSVTCNLLLSDFKDECLDSH